jgi:hypothetical protein
MKKEMDDLDDEFDGVDGIRHGPTCHIGSSQGPEDNPDITPSLHL